MMQQYRAPYVVMRDTGSRAEIHPITHRSFEPAAGSARVRVSSRVTGCRSRLHGKSHCGVQQNSAAPRTSCRATLRIVGYRGPQLFPVRPDPPGRIRYGRQCASDRPQSADERARRRVFAWWDPIASFFTNPRAQPRPALSGAINAIVCEFLLDYVAGREYALVCPWQRSTLCTSFRRAVHKCNEDNVGNGRAFASRPA